jgi:hypothetical protein
MFRRILNSYLIAVLLAGPWLCCCSLSRASTILSPSSSTQPITTHSCCHSESDKSSPEKSHRCPCRQHHDQQVISLSEAAFTVSDQIVAQHFWLSIECCIVSGNSLLGATDPDHLVQQSLDSLYPTSRELLRAISVMRC